MVIKRVGPLSVAKVSGLLYALMGLLFGACISLFMMAAGSLAGGPWADTPQLGGAMFGAIFGVGAIVFLPIFYGVMGFVFGGIGAAIYNVVAGWIGGIEIETQ
jgi:hypothetical protein